MGFSQKFEQLSLYLSNYKGIRQKKRENLARATELPLTRLSPELKRSLTTRNLLSSSDYSKR